MKILIAFDGSDCARAAIDDLAVAGLPKDVEAVVVSVADVWAPLLDPDPPPADRLANPAIQMLTEKSRKRAQEAFEEARELCERGAERVRGVFTGWNVRGEAVAGSPYAMLIRRAAELDVDLVVVGSHGRSAVGRAVLGSVSQKVMQHAHCSVRIGRGSAGEGKVSVRAAKILIGVDGSVGAATAVSAVAGRAWAAGSEVRAVCAWESGAPPFLYPGSRLIADSAVAAIARTGQEELLVGRTLAAVAEEIGRPGLTVTTAVREGDAKQVLLSEAREWGADCIFVGAQGLTLIERFLIGSVSAAVAARAHCSVEVIRS
jgi:nucleotide-binding universal stress UspA family protein